MFNTYYSASPWYYHAPTEEVEMMDGNICEQATCSKCGCVGLEYWPYHNRETDEYLALMKCPECNYEEEF